MAPVVGRRCTVMAERIEHNPISLDEALDMHAMAKAGYEYVWYQELSRVGICRLEAYEPDTDRIIEARIFRNTAAGETASEVHVFMGQDGQKKAVQTTASDAQPWTEERQLLQPHYGKSLTVRTVYTFDDDGQAMPGAFLLTGYEDGGSNGE